MKFYQKELTLNPQKRGFHIITGTITENFHEIEEISTGLLHIFIKHTSASLTVNENADPTVRRDFETFFTRMIPDGADYFEHDMEGPDDMPAHIKASLLGTDITIPVTNGQLNLGTWQGIYLCEHRDYGGKRTIVLTLTGI